MDSGSMFLLVMSANNACFFVKRTRISSYDPLMRISSLYRTLTVECCGQDSRLGSGSGDELAALSHSFC